MVFAAEAATRRRRYSGAGLKKGKGPVGGKPDSVPSPGEGGRRLPFIYPAGAGSPEGGATHPGPSGGPPGPLFSLAPDWVYRAPDGCPPGGELLPHLFTLTPRRARGGMFSVALAVTAASRPPCPRLRGESCPVVSGLSSTPPKRGSGSPPTDLEHTVARMGGAGNSNCQAFAGRRARASCLCEEIAGLNPMSRKRPQRSK